MSDKKIEVLNNLLIQIEKSISFKDKKNTQISKSDIGWQLDHALKVINAVCPILAKTDPKKYKSNFNLWRTILFSLSYFPRGKARAPKIVSPPNIIHTQDLRRAHHVADQMQAGMIQVNASGEGMQRFAPFGGMKQSGYGRLGGEQGLMEFLQTKNVWMNLAPLDKKDN